MRPGVGHLVLTHLLPGPARRRTSVDGGRAAYGAPVDVATLHRTFDV